MPRPVIEVRAKDNLRTRPQRDDAVGAAVDRPQTQMHFHAAGIAWRLLRWWIDSIHPLPDTNSLDQVHGQTSERRRC